MCHQLIVNGMDLFVEEVYSKWSILEKRSPKNYPAQKKIEPFLILNNDRTCTSTQLVCGRHRACFACLASMVVLGFLFQTFHSVVLFL